MEYALIMLVSSKDVEAQDCGSKESGTVTNAPGHDRPNKGKGKKASKKCQGSCQASKDGKPPKKSQCKCPSKSQICGHTNSGFEAPTKKQVAHDHHKKKGDLKIVAKGENSNCNAGNDRRYRPSSAPPNHNVEIRNLRPHVSEGLTNHQTSSSHVSPPGIFVTNFSPTQSRSNSSKTSLRAPPVETPIGIRKVVTPRTSALASTLSPTLTPSRSHSNEHVLSRDTSGPLPVLEEDEDSCSPNPSPTPPPQPNHDTYTSKRQKTTDRSKIKNRKPSTIYEQDDPETESDYGSRESMIRARKSSKGRDNLLA